MDFLPVLTASILLGLFVGVFSGLLGIGGGTTMVPAFRLLFHMSPLMSTATSLFTIVPTSLSGALSHIRQKTCHVPLGVVLGLGGAVTSPLGVWLATISPAWAVMLVAALVIGYSATDMLIKAAKMKPSSFRGDSLQEETPQGASDIELTKPTRKLESKQIVIGFAIGLCAGTVSGYIGVGGGFIMVPLMTMLLGVPMKKASGTSLIAMIILAIPGAIGQGIAGNIDYFVGLATALGSVPGAIMGAALIKRVSERNLRFVFGISMVLAAIMLVVNEFAL